MNPKANLNPENLKNPNSPEAMLLTIIADISEQMEDIPSLFDELYGEAFRKINRGTMTWEIMGKKLDYLKDLLEQRVEESFRKFQDLEKVIDK